MTKVMVWDVTEDTYGGARFRVKYAIEATLSMDHAFAPWSWTA